MWIDDARARLRRGETLVDEAGVQADQMTMFKLYEETVARFWAGSKAEETTTSNALRVVMLLGRDRPVEGVDAAAVDAVVVTLQKKGLSGGTINRHLATLSKMLKFAHTRRWIKYVPPIERREESEHRIRFYSAAEEKKILDWFVCSGNPVHHDLIVLLLDTGLRLGEALRLRFVDVQSGMVSVVTAKGGRPRSVPQTARVTEMLSRRLANVRPMHTTARVFDPLTKDGVEKRWVKCREAVGLKDDEQAVLHACRHTFASRLVQAAVPILHVQQLLGHASLQMTMRYAHLAPADLSAAVRALEQHTQAARQV